MTDEQRHAPEQPSDQYIFDVARYVGISGTDIEAFIKTLAAVGYHVTPIGDDATPASDRRPFVERGEAVNLARNWLDAQSDRGGMHITNKGVRTLAEAVMLMDHALKNNAAPQVAQIPSPGPAVAAPSLSECTGPHSDAYECPVHSPLRVQTVPCVAERSALNPAAAWPFPKKEGE